MRYTVGHNYYSRRDGLDYGPWQAGTEIELPDEVAEWALRDSPGVLTPVQPEPVSQPEPVVEAEPDPEREAKPARDRQHRGGRTRRA